MSRPLLLALAALCAAAVTTLTADAALAERRVALVIGNSAYRNGPALANTANDAAAIAQMFKNAGFDVVEAKRDLGSLDFKRAVREFTSQTKNADIAVVYYAGHGIEIDGTNYLVPVDAKLATDFDAEDEAVSLDRVVRSLEPARRLRLVILDACRDNPFTKVMKRQVAVRAVPSGLGKIEPTTSDTLIAYAAKAGSVSFDGNGPNSPFTTALVKYLAEPGLDIRLALGRVRDEVLRVTGNKQEPFVYGSLGGTTVSLVPAVAKRIEPPPVAANPTTDIRRDYEFAERVGTRIAWEAFLGAHPDGFYANLARAQLSKLGAPQVEAVVRAEPAKPNIQNREREEREALQRRQDEERRAKAEADRQREAHVKAEADRQREANARAETDRQREAHARAEAERQREAHARAEAEQRAKLDREAALKAHAERQRLEREAAAKPDGEARAAPISPADACKRDEERLVRLRASRARDEVMRFERELACERLRPQVVRLRESVASD